MRQIRMLGRKSPSWALALVLGAGAGASLGVCGQARADEPASLPPPPAQPMPTGDPATAPYPAPMPPPAESASSPQHPGPGGVTSGAPAYAPDPQPAPQPAAPGPGQGQGRRGFVVAANLGIRPAFFPQDRSGSTTTALGLAMQGGVAFGFKVGRVTLTLGLDLSSIDVQGTFDYQSATTFLIVPGLQVALLRSRDHRVELLGSVRFGAGSTVTSDNGSGNSPPALIMYELAPAMRFWAHRQFAIQFLAGYSGEYALTKTTVSSTATGLHGVTASLGAVGLF